MDSISSSKTHFGLPGNSYGLVDKQKAAVGLQEQNLESDLPSVTERDHLFMFDTRDCIGELSLREAQTAFAYFSATSGKITPEDFKKTLNSNGVVVPSKLVQLVSDLSRSGDIKGFPSRDKQPYIKDNIITFQLPRILKQVKSLEIINAIIPRDIIPVYVYFPGFIDNCLPFTLSGTGVDYISPKNINPSSNWTSPIPETYEDFYDDEIQGMSSNKLGGVYQTPLRYWRAYTGANCMANPHTPPPYQLWNPPQDKFSQNPWPFQPQPVRNQRTPTYVSRNGVIFSGFGLYDLDDFPVSQELQLSNGSQISIPLRKLILKLLVPNGQYINGISTEELIDISDVTDFNESGIVDNPLVQTGYGDYQRFIPGPGLGMNYQPNQIRDLKSAPIEIGLSTYDPITGYIGPMPVPFPNFRGNVWGPYNRPGDRFQNMSVQLTLDELYMNGDLDNLEGNSVIWPSFDPSTQSYTFEMYIATLKRANNIIRFRNVESSSNPNIKNSMRVEYDGGFGAVYAYVGKNTIERGKPGPIITGGLPNTQYDGKIKKFNSTVWMTPRADIPEDWIQSLPGPQRPTIVKSDTFSGWIYIWRNIFPWTGSAYVPITAGGTGPMEYFDGDITNPEWLKDVGSSSMVNITSGSSQWSASPVIGMSNTYCIPSGVPSSFEYVGNLPFGIPSGIELSVGGSNYQSSSDNFSGNPLYTMYQYMYVPVINTGTNPLLFVLDRYIRGRFTLEETSIFYRVTGVDSRGTITSETKIPSGDRYAGLFALLPGDNIEGVTGVNSIYISYGGPDFFPHKGGGGYLVSNGLRTATDNGTGIGLIVNILEVSENDAVVGIVTAFEISEPGSGYRVGDIIRVLQQGSFNNCMFRISGVSSLDNDIIPSENNFHYHDPLAVGPVNYGQDNYLSVDYVNGNNVCQAACTSAADNCTPPGGEYIFKVGEKISSSSSAADDPRPTPVPKDMLKCDFRDQLSPIDEWNAEEIKNCRPLNNSRILQTSTYIDKRTAYSDLGSNNGAFLGALINYRAFFVSSTPDTDIIIRIKQAERTVYTQSLNQQVSQSNFNMPIRLSLGTASGTLEYVEAVAGSLTSSGVYWKKDYFPPKAELSDLTIEFWTYNGTPIPMERCLGFFEQFTEQAVLYSSNIASSYILHGNYAAFQPNLPPFATTTSLSPSSIVITSNTNSKSLNDPFNPKTSNYTQRNLGLMLKMVTYHAQNPGITGIIKQMPASYVTQTESFVDDEGNDKELIPLAGNIDSYH
jgi:hypothetical protein